MENSNYHKANFQVKKYLQKNILDYSRLRNFDFGPENRTNVSNLSKFISHRVLNEFKLIKTVLNKYEFTKVEKFIQEIFWRIYWKGWLENRPAVWKDFVSSLNTIKIEENYRLACEGDTRILCFNDWVRELKEHNYLHNHSRMWFASIWIFTLRLPWQLGAKFFLEHLNDGDAASNTLSWRWVAGLQTKNKNYIAKSWNIQKFTNNKYLEANLNEEAVPIEETKAYPLEETNFNLPFEKKNENIILFENDLCFEGREELYKSYKNVYVIFLENNLRRLKLSKKVCNFKKNLTKDFKKNFQNCELINLKNLESNLSLFKNFDLVYPSIGENLDFINNLKVIKKIELNILFRKEDVFCWKYSHKGFFNFKNNISKIVNELNLCKN